MKKIVIIGANSFQNPLILKAKKLGYETHVFAWKDGSIGEETADYFYPISIVEKEEILAKCKEIKPDAVVTIASDLANITVQYLSEHLGLVCNSSKTIEITTNKYAMRSALKKGGLPTPNFIKVSGVHEISDNTFDSFSFPVIVKPTDRSGSRGIYKANSLEEIVDCIGDSIELSMEKAAIVEEYIEGEEYSCEYISFQSQHSFLALTKKYTTGAPHFIETGHIEPAPVSDELLNKVKTVVSTALTVLGIEYGPSHTELKIDSEGNIRIIEIGSRMGGDCIGSNLVELSTGLDFVKMTIDTALGQAPNFTKLKKTYYAGIRFIFDDHDLAQFEQVKNDREVVFFSGLENNMSDAVTDSSSRKGYYILACDSYPQLLKYMG